MVDKRPTIEPHESFHPEVPKNISIKSRDFNFLNDPNHEIYKRDHLGRSVKVTEHRVMEDPFDADSFFYYSHHYQPKLHHKILTGKGLAVIVVVIITAFIFKNIFL